MMEFVKKHPTFIIFIVILIVLYLFNKKTECFEYPYCNL